MDDLLDRILSHDECRDYTIKKFEQMLDEIDWDCVVILQFCMHTLKWPTIKEKAAALLAVTDKINAERWYRHVLESFDDNWPDRDLWERYAPSDL
ncbi:hypothetical protein SAMN05660733_03522 [Lentzea albidocapillata]|uniref:Uncharacterized protein n=2 Tax=Lentzea albidocapillata TaxID=40571 RepID=A0A1W2E099_9PSEU|nr:hypothetical protein SAMN05660733_03522 [Lentzea albidocapillata]